ncbi:MAG: molybdopterin-guanine dinucleotide biosynthesis protein B [Candidatus Acididesulfobacter diazotrophicus]|uniref:Molybdopterin-guanine dinucleotide biosynthesis protein B n=1 Tax=Candidatus Acididesulfobacter diazotrophicus TaxID=2597226 RepID=A0A519BK78_9DELT|nr:MAG: molybdopterin-guanine dinucleotide biosynthesis protein B [Candidatus Acididesulfobacter diazotrophicus]
MINMKDNLDRKPFAVSFIAKSGTGKTTLIEKLIKIFAGKKYKVSSIKHTDHKFEADIKGKDSWIHKHAGAFSTMLLSDDSMAFFSDIKKPDAFDVHNNIDSGRNINTIDSLINKFFYGSDILIVEGFKDVSIPKVELFRKELNPELQLKYADDDDCILVCGDVLIDNLNKPQININESDKIAVFLEKFIKK